jgi:caa(3)-type oxidase subunit IV
VIALLRTPATGVWVVLIVATAATWTLGTNHGFGNHTLASVAILLIAFIKVRLVGLYFMELRDAPPCYGDCSRRIAPSRAQS